MDFDTVRPLISGIAGALLASWLLAKLAKRLPYSDNRSKQRSIEISQKRVIFYANIGACIGIATGLILYFGKIFDSYDWRGFGLMMGVTALLPVLVIIFANFAGGAPQIREGFIAYSLSQKAPPFILFPLLVTMLLFGAWATIALL